jgi:hypothetical protein
MTVHANPSPAFDHAAAVLAARRDYPLETARVTFVDLSSPDAAAQLRDWLRAASPAFIRSLGDTEKPETAIFHAVEKFLAKNGVAEVDYATGKILVASASRPKSKYLGPTATAAQEAAYAFAHELGHAVARNGFTANWRGTTRNGKPSPHDALSHERAEAEMAADVFAVLRNLSQQTMTLEQARAVSLTRALRAPGIHSTSPALDAALDDTGNTILSLQDVRATAETVAQRHAPKAGEIEELAAKLAWMKPVPKAPDSGHDMAKQLKGVFDRISHRAPRNLPMPQGTMRLEKLTQQEWLQNVAEVYNAAPKGSLAAHVTEKILRHTPKNQISGHALKQACKKLNRRRG